MTKEITLTGEEFQQFASDFLHDQLWISPEDGGSNKKGGVRCIRVLNSESGERVLVNSEGQVLELEALLAGGKEEPVPDH